MNRSDFRQKFNATGPVVLPVIHVLDSEQAQRNIEAARDGGCPGVFLINHDFEKEKLIPIIKDEAEEIAQIRRNSGWDGLYIGGTAFKKQREVAPEHYGKSAEIATRYMDVVVTSGVATGHAADVGKIDTFRTHCGDTALGLASGITPQNAGQYADAVDLFMVATGINYEGDFYNIDPALLQQLMNQTQK